VIPDAEVETA
jgi:hypothetical protein